MVPDIDHNELVIKVTSGGTDKGAVKISVPELKLEQRGKAGEVLKLKLTDYELWSPDNPKLYDVSVELMSVNGKVDKIKSYFGMRKIALGKDLNGITRIFLNNQPLFMYGPLDQGWWPDGLYSAPSDDALRYDLEVTKKLGFTLVRKHVKVEPLRWYYPVSYTHLTLPTNREV